MPFASRTYWATLAVLVALIITPYELNAGYFQLPKLILLGCGLSLGAAALFLNRDQLTRTLPRVTIGLLIIYLLWITLTNTVWSSQPTYTLLGWRDWYGGWAAQTMYVLIFLMASFRPRQHRTSTAVKDKAIETENMAIITRRPPRWLMVMACLTAVLCLVSVLEMLGFNPLVGSQWFSWKGVSLTPAETGVPFATVGNSGWLAGLWVLMAPLPFLIQAKSSRWLILWQTIIAVGVGATHSKAAIFLVCAMYIGWALKQWIGRRESLRRTIVAAGLITITLSTTPALNNLNSELYKHHIVSRDNKIPAVTNAEVAVGSLGARILLSRGTWRLIKERPLTGWGLETIQHRFFGALTPEEYRQYMTPVLDLKEDDVVRNFGMMHLVTKREEPGAIKKLSYFEVVKPHNAVLEEIYSNGVIGFALLTIAIIPLIIQLLRSESRAAHLLLIAFFAYVIYLQVWFVLPAVTPLAYLLLAFAARSKHVPDANDSLKKAMH